MNVLNINFHKDPFSGSQAAACMHKNCDFSKVLHKEVNAPLKKQV